MKFAAAVLLLLLLSLTAPTYSMEVHVDDLCTRSESLSPLDCEIIQKAADFAAQKDFGPRKVSLIVTVGTLDNDCDPEGKSRALLYRNEASFSQAESHYHERQRHRLLKFECENRKDQVVVLHRSTYEETSTSQWKKDPPWILSADLPGYNRDKSAAVTVITSYSNGSLVAESIRLVRTPDGWTILDSAELWRICGFD